MSCCGGKRRQFAAGTRVAQGGRQRMQRSNGVAQTVVDKVFEYTGRTALTVRGPISRRLYRFSKYKSRIVVDGRDVKGLTAVPNLQRVLENST